jgi:hypothetical protein
MRKTLKRIFDREPWRTIFLLILSAFVMFVFYKGVLKNPALDPERIGQTAEVTP